MQVTGLTHTVAIPKAPAGTNRRTRSLRQLASDVELAP